MTNPEDNLPYSLTGVREDAQDLVKSTMTKDEVIQLAEDYYNGSANPIDGTLQDVVAAFLGAWDYRVDYGD